MDRIALSKRIGGLADVFTSGSRIRRELEAMSYVLENMDDEKFATILNEGYTADASEDEKEAQGVRGLQPTAPSRIPDIMERRRQRTQQMGTPDVPVFEPRDPRRALQTLMSSPKVQEAIQNDPILKNQFKQAAEALGIDLEKPEGNSWNREASEAVARNLIADIFGKEAMEKAVCCDTGRKLDKKQMPDATKKQEKPATLTDEQTPKLSEALDSDMYEKSQGSVRKEAGSRRGPRKPDGTGPGRGSSKCPYSGEETNIDEKEAGKKSQRSPKDDTNDKPKDDTGDDPSVAQQQAQERQEKAVAETQQKAEEGAKATAKRLKELSEMTQTDASQQSDAMLSFEGIELGAPMTEVELNDEDKNTLGKLFG